MNRLLQLFFALLLLFNISCNSDSEFTQDVFYGNGILIANEGNFGTPNADVTFLSGDLNLKQDNIFSSNNSGANLGDVLQSITFNGGRAFLLLNNSNKIQVVDRYTFKKLGEITEQLSSPRYMAIANNFIYVTNDKYNGEKYVTVYNAGSFSFVKKIPFTDTAERIVEAGGNVFVQNASFGFGNKITSINTSTNSILSVITLPNGNINKTISSNSNVYTIAAGTADSYIYQISNAGNIVKTTTLTGITNATNLEIYNGKYYFSSGNNVYAMDMNATAVPTTPLFTVTANSYSTLYGFNIVNGLIFTSDANGFTQDSKITVYSAAGALIKTFTAGKSSNGFYQN
ncbi:hypothetical protein M2347_000276 [Chryseobacterium sp. H1D6B]|uniref:YncE family protein n=1 Tax=Chryseobacterium sp. H1D6B TaxID=2940588 RepID=UPI00184EA430|nr:hypothetical protein [Chryseobacterium sp. H1D6B]MDH6250549.1 hypothetical protein [Chryseobacterium sp. H1D6B]